MQIKGKNMKPLDITEMPIIRRTTPISLASQIQPTIPVNMHNNDIKYKTVTIIFKFLLFDFLDKTRVNVAAIKRNKIITKKGEDEIREKSNFILSKNVISSIIFISPSFILYLLILQLQQFVYFLFPKYM